MNDAYEIGGRLNVHVQGLTAPERRAIGASLDPCRPSATVATADIVVEADSSIRGALLDMQRDAGDGRLTGTDGRRFYVLERGFACAVPPLDARDARPPVTFAAEPGFPIAPAFGRLVRPRLQLALLARGAAAVHAAAVELDGKAVLVAGWSESGKTETALAFVEEGARFLSDKWTVVADDGTASVFPITVGVRGWVLRYLPRLDAALGSRERGRIRIAALMRTITRPIAPGAASSARERVLTVADRVAVRPSAVRRLYGDDPGAPWQAPLAAVALLRTVPPDAAVRAQRVDPSWAASRLALTANFERRAIFELYDRAQWSASDPDCTVRCTLMARERALLERVLDSIPVIEVTAPFPTDPRPVAQAIARLL
jgi:hypothetical protein